MEYKPLSGRDFPRFSAIKTFFRLPIASIDDDFDVAIFGLPFDGGVSYRPGARFAPTSVRDHSSLGRSFSWSRGVSLFDSLKIADIGDCPTVPISREQTYARIEKFVAQLIAAKKRFLSIGGDHSTTLPILRALKQTHGPVGLIHFDAHLDTYPAAWGEEFHHGSFLRHAVEEGLVDPTRSLQLGLRGPLAGGDDLEFVKKHKIPRYTVDDIRSRPLSEVCQSLPKFSDGGPMYLSYDIDCLDPVYAPGTGTPVPGGLTTYETQHLLRALQVSNLVGADIVEISPPFDLAGLTALAGVDAAFEILCLMAPKS